MKSSKYGKDIIASKEAIQTFLKEVAYQEYEADRDHAWDDWRNESMYYLTSKLNDSAAAVQLMELFLNEAIKQMVEDIMAVDTKQYWYDKLFELRTAGELTREAWAQMGEVRVQAEAAASAAFDSVLAKGMQSVEEYPMPDFTCAADSISGGSGGMTIRAVVLTLLAEAAKRFAAELQNYEGVEEAVCQSWQLQVCDALHKEEGLALYTSAVVAECFIEQVKVHHKALNLAPF